MSASTNPSNAAAAAAPDHAFHLSRLKKRHAELSTVYDNAHRNELAAIEAAGRPADSAAAERRQMRAMMRAIAETTALADAILAIENQMRRVDLDVQKARAARDEQETRRTERAKRETIRTAMAEDRRFAAMELHEAKLAAVTGAAAPANSEPARAPRKPTSAASGPAPAVLASADQPAQQDPSRESA
jgi:hypothetical protein